MADADGDVQANGIHHSSNITEDENRRDSGQHEGSSDGEGEKSARERLKETTIEQKTQTANQELTEQASANVIPTESTESNSNGNNIRGRPAKKRSFEDLTRDETNPDDSNLLTEPPNPKSGHHKRMRSRDIAGGEPIVGSKFEHDMASPVHEESDIEAEKSPGGPGILVEAPSSADIPPKTATTLEPVQEVTDTTVVEPTISPSSDASATNQTSKLAPTSGFANASSTSPFGSVTSPSKTSTEGQESKSTSYSAFASSGLSAFAASEKSPFGAAAGKSAGGFGGGSSTGGFGSSSGGFGGTSPFASSKPSTGGFGSTKSAFGSTSGFGSSTGFGAVKPFGSGLSSFGSSTTTGAFGSGKPFGTSKKDDDEDDGSDHEGAGDDTVQSGEDYKDSRFVAQEVETGEEDEETIFVARAKLYHYEKEWKERGVGVLKMNIRKLPSPSPEERKGGSQSTNREVKARLIMRTDGVHRVILNTPLFRDMKVGQTDGTEPTGKTMHLSGLEDGKPRAFQVKIGKEDVLKELYWKIIQMLEELQTTHKPAEELV